MLLLLPLLSIAQEQEPAMENDRDAYFEKEFSIPYFSITNAEVTAPVEIISGEELVRLPSTDLEEMLTGKIANGEFTSLSNRPGADKTRMRIRGFSYLVLVDGIPRPVNEVSPYEIESVNILKGLSATAMYGPDARDGVIYIKTKRGTSYEKYLNVDVEYGMHSVNRNYLPKWLNAADYATLYNEAARNDGLPEHYSPEAIAFYKSGEAPVRYPDEDMYNQIFNNNMAFRRANMNYGGGNNTTRYFFNLSYLGEGNRLFKINSLTYNEIGLRSNLDIKITDFLDVSVGAYGKYDILQSPNTEDLTWQQIAGNNQHSIWPVLSNYPVNAYPVTIAPDTFGTSEAFPINPVGDLTNHLQTTEHRITGRFNIGLNLNLSNWVRGLKASSQMAYDLNSASAFSQRPDRTYALYAPVFYDDGNNEPDSLIQYGLDDASAGIRQVYDDYNTFFYNLTKIEYDRVFGRHMIHTALANSLSSFSYKLPNAMSQDERKQNLSYNLFYAFDQKYYASFILSYSGIMNLPEERRYGLFPTFGAGWVISEEAFMSESEVIDILKLRASYGTMGYYNNNSLFLYRTFWDLGPWVEFNNRTETASESYRGTILSQLGNGAIDFGKQKELNIGMDLKLFNSLFIAADYYNIEREGIILNAPVPSIIGTSSYMDNIGANNYSGFDLSVDYTYATANEFSLSFGLRAGYAVSEVIASNEVEYPYPWIGSVGNPTDAIYGLVADGLLSEADLEQTNQMFGTVMAGNIRYTDLNEDGAVQSFIDEKLIGHSRPRYNYGITVNVRYKKAGIYILGYGLADYDINVRNNPYFYAYENRKYSAHVAENRWTLDNPDPEARHPRLTTGTSNNDDRNSSYWLIDGSFFMIKNIELSYRFDGRENGNIPGVMLFLRGTNLFTVSGLRELDPGNTDLGISTYPSMRTFTTGFSLSF